MTSLALVIIFLGSKMVCIIIQQCLVCRYIHVCTYICITHMYMIGTYIILCMYVCMYVYTCITHMYMYTVCQCVCIYCRELSGSTCGEELWEACLHLGERWAWDTWNCDLWVIIEIHWMQCKYSNTFIKWKALKCKPSVCFIMQWNIPLATGIS